MASLARVGAYELPFESTTHADRETAFLDWVEVQHPAVHGVMEKSSRYASLYSVEADHSLLECKGCSHVKGLAAQLVATLEMIQAMLRGWQRGESCWSTGFFMDTNARGLRLALVLQSCAACFWLDLLFAF